MQRTRLLALALVAASCQTRSDQPPAATSAPTANEPASSSARVASPPTPRTVIDGQALALALSESSDDCRATLAAARDYAQSRSGAWEKLDRLEDPLGRAFKGFAHYLAGRFARAERMRELLVDHQLARTPDAPLLVQHIQLIRGTFAHCADETLTPENGRVTLPEALCWPWRVAPEAADRAYVSTQYDWSGWSPEGCGRSVSRRRATQEREPCVDRYYGLGVAHSFEESLRCAREQGDVRLHVIQLLNGQGTARDLDGAARIYDSAAYWGRWNLLLAWQLDARLAQPERTFPDLDYCDVATFTSQLNQCSHLAFRRTEQRAAAERARARSRLDRRARSALDALQREHLSYREARAQIDEDDTLGGTGSAGIVFAAQTDLEQLHAEHIQRWLGARRFEPASVEQLEDAQRLHADVAREQLEPAAPDTTPADTGAPVPLFPNDWMARERQAIARRRPLLLAQARRSSQRYRQLWVAVAQSQAPRPLAPEAVERSVLRALLHEQVAQLTYESFVPPLR